MGLSNLVLLSVLSQAVYQPDLQAVTERNGCSLLRAPPRGERAFRSHYAIVRRGADLIVVFRGTNSIKDWVTNLYSGPVRVTDRLYAHRGYWEAVSWEMHPMLVSLSNALAGQTNPRIYLTGHSKGGGEAILAYLWWTTNAHDVANNFPGLRGARVSVVTFGAPLVVMADEEGAASGMETAIVNYVTPLSLIHI